MARLTLLLIAAVVAAAAGSLRRVCYYTNWAQYRNGPAKFYPENVDPSLCTHLIYAFAKLNGNKLVAYEWNDESTPWMKGMYERFAAVKKTNPSVKTLLSVGGWNMASAPFTRMVSSDANIREFATTTVAFLRKHDFDGVDIDWEYPANRGSPPGDKHRFTVLLQIVHDEFAREQVPAGKQRLMLASAVAAGRDKIDTAYEVTEISKYLDMINLMTYDLHGSWEDHTGHHSPLYQRSGETGNDTFLNVDWVTHYWVAKGAPKDKLNVGLALYGRTFRLPWSHTSDGMGAAAAGAGAAGHYTNEAGFIAYYEICEKLKAGATKHFEAQQKVPYFVDNDLWCGYEDPDSLKIKVDFVKQEGFGGIMVWALDLDDFSGSCGQGKYPLMKAIVNELNNPTSGGLPVHPIQQTTTIAPVTQPPYVQVTTAQPVYTQPPQSQTTSHIQTIQSGHHNIVMVYPGEFNCQTRSDGYYPSPTKCNEYYICANNLGFRTDCHPGLYFNPVTLYCDFSDHVNCQSPNVMAPVTQPPQTQPPQTQPPQTQPPQTQPPQTQPPYVPMTTKPSGSLNPNDFCKGKQDGFYKDPTDCSYFYQCSFGISYHDPCPSGTYYSESMQGCDWAANVPNCP